MATAPTSPASARLEAMAKSSMLEGETLAQARLRIAEQNPDLYEQASIESAPPPTTRRFVHKTPVAKILPPAGPARDAYECLERTAELIRASDPELQGMDPTRAERLSMAKAYVQRPDMYNAAFG